MLLSVGVTCFASGIWLWLVLPFLPSSRLDSGSWACRKQGKSEDYVVKAWRWPWHCWSVEPTSTTVYLYTSWDMRKINKLLFVYVTVWQIICYLGAPLTHTSELLRIFLSTRVICSGLSKIRLLISGIKSELVRWFCSRFFLSYGSVVPRYCSCPCDLKTYLYSRQLDILSASTYSCAHSSLQRKLVI